MPSRLMPSRCCWLRDRNGIHPACENLSVGNLVWRWWWRWFDWSFAHLGVLVFATGSSIISCCSKINPEWFYIIMPVFPSWPGILELLLNWVFCCCCCHRCAVFILTKHRCDSVIIAIASLSHPAYCSVLADTLMWSNCCLCSSKVTLYGLTCPNILMGRRLQHDTLLTAIFQDNPKRMT